MPIGPVGKPTESALAINAMVFKHTKFPNAAKAYLAFMMEAPQYDKWLTDSFGYWGQPLKAYAKSAVWKNDPKIAVYRDTMAASRWLAYPGRDQRGLGRRRRRLRGGGHGGRRRHRRQHAGGRGPGSRAPRQALLPLTRPDPGRHARPGSTPQFASGTRNWISSLACSAICRRLFRCRTVALRTCVSATHRQPIR